MKLNAVRAMIEGIPGHRDQLFLTGSRAFGVQTPDSDWDLCCRIGFYFQLLDVLRATENITELSSSARATIIKCDDGVINLIPQNDDHFNAWAQATLMLRTMCQNSVTLKQQYSAKYARIRIFEYLVVGALLTGFNKGSAQDAPSRLGLGFKFE